MVKRLAMLEEVDIQEMEVKYVHTKDPQGFMNTYQKMNTSGLVKV